MYNSAIASSTDSLNAGRAGSRTNLFVANPSGSTNTPLVSMEDTLDKLKCLRYIQLFCRPNRINPFHKYYFTTPSQNANEQFYHFVLLFSWLAKIANPKLVFETPGQFDDPNATCSNMAAVLKKLNIAFDYAPTKLKPGNGEAVTYVIQAVCDLALSTSKFSYGKPAHKNEEVQEEAQVDDDAEITADDMEEHIHEEEGEEDALFVTAMSKTTSQPGRSSPTANPTPIKPTIDPQTWHLEVERVTPMLRIQLPNDNKDWRIHLEQMNHHGAAIHKTMEETRNMLAKLHAEVEKTLEKISSRERYIQTQFETQIDQYKSIQDQLSELKQKYGVASSNVNELTNELARVSDELDGLKSRMDELGSGMTDSKPLVNIKQAVQKVKGDIKQMDLRLGVIEHTLLHAKMKNKTNTLGLAVDATSFSFGAGLDIMM